MASSSKSSVSPVRTLASSYEWDDSDMLGMDAYFGMSRETLEKSLTNLNIHIASLVAQREELANTFKEFCAHFAKQQEVIGEETKQLRSEMHKLRKNTKHGV